MAALLGETRTFTGNPSTRHRINGKQTLVFIKKGDLLSASVLVTTQYNNVLLSYTEW